MLELKHTDSDFEAGCDEAGRGCLAGPVVAAAVILPNDYTNKILNDSKQVSEKKRDLLRIEIEKEAISFGVGILDNKVIDKENILRSSFLAMHAALDQLKTKAEFILVDGNRFIPYHEIPYKCMVKGDARFLNIAAASILAKTYRDEIMFKLHEEFPHYGWSKNKGYPTKLHRDGIRKHGPTKYHRMSFTLLPKQIDIIF